MASEKAKKTQDDALEMARKHQAKPGGLLETLAGKATTRFWDNEIQKVRKARQNIVKDYLIVGLLR